MRIMAVDYGDARTGLAVSDASGTLVGEAWVLNEKNQKAAAKTIAGDARSRDVGMIVVGYPKNMDGSVGPRAEKSERLAELLREECDVEVVLWDERMTSVSANRILSDAGKKRGKQRAKVDAVAAAIILQNYLDFLRGLRE